ncbi:MAG: ABC transporter ATP-binding protein [Pseudomonadota bacterium]
MEGADLRVERITSGYRDYRVIEDFYLSFPKSAITVIIGPNGCGKSTLLKTMARVLPVQTGRVMVRGHPVHGSPSKKVAKRMALLPQEPVAFQGLRVRELVAQGRFPNQCLVRQGSPEDGAAVAQAMDQTSVTEFADRPIERLSGGQRQRVWIAMVLAQDTPILLLDEPTTFLDLKVQVDLMTLLRRIAHDEGRTLVVVIHQLNLAAAFADRRVMMRAGGIAAERQVQKVFTKANLATVFDLAAKVLTDPESGRPVCVPQVVPDECSARRVGALCPCGTCAGVPLARVLGRKNHSVPRCRRRIPKL